jgi:hypothetical protein
MSSFGLMVTAENSGLRDLGFKPITEAGIFQAPFIWIKPWNKKKLLNVPNYLALLYVL